MKSNKVVLLIVLPAVALLTMVICAFAIRLPRTYSLVRNARSTTGLVISVEPENHRSIRFEYEIDGKTYVSLGSAENIQRSFESMQIGEAVPITYDGTDHASSVMGPPERYLSDAFKGMAFAFVGLTVSFVLYLLKRK